MEVFAEGFAEEVEADSQSTHGLAVEVLVEGETGLVEVFVDSQSDQSMVEGFGRRIDRFS